MPKSVTIHIQNPTLNQATSETIASVQKMAGHTSRYISLWKMIKSIVEGTIPDIEWIQKRCNDVLNVKGFSDVDF